MAAIVASRFSVLKIEDDSDQEREKAARKKAAEDEKNKKKLTKKKKKSKPVETLDAELASMAFGMPKPSKAKKKQPAGGGANIAASPKKISESDLADWERRDQQLLEDTYERELQEAMMISKVEFERVAANVPDPEAPVEPTRPSKPGKKLKPNVVTVDQLQVLSTEQIDNRDFSHLQPAAPVRPAPPPEAPPAAAGDGADFFDQMERRTRETVSREKAIARIRAEGPVPVAGSAEHSEELQLRLAARESELEELTAELERTRGELKQAKTRTKRILGVLDQAETKEKVQLIIEIEKVREAREAADRDRADMSAQVAALTAELEQERSKVHQLTTQLKRALGNKRRGVSENEDHGD